MGVVGGEWRGARHGLRSPLEISSGSAPERNDSCKLIVNSVVYCCVHSPVTLCRRGLLNIAALLCSVINYLSLIDACVFDVR